MQPDPFIAGFEAVMRMAPGAWALLDRRGALLLENVGFSTLHEPGGLFQLEGRTLHAKRVEENEALQAALITLAPDNPRETICLRSRQGQPVMLLDLLFAPEPGLIVLRAAPLVAAPPGSVRRLQHIFGFTPAEARIAIAMEAGASLQEIATANRTGLETVRGQVKSIRTKAGARSQSQLVAMLVRASGDWDTIS